MPGIHPNTDYDPVARATAEIRTMEAEVLDDRQLLDVLSTWNSLLAARAQAATKRASDAYMAKVEDNRRDLIRSKAKGVGPVESAPKLALVAPSIIPSRH